MDLDVNSVGLNQLANMYKDKDWYHSVGFDKYGRYVLYIKYTCNETLHDLPDFVFGKQLLVHFGASATAKRDQFVENLQSVGRIMSANLSKQLSQEDNEELSNTELETAIIALIAKWNADLISEIFFEIHDGPNALTQISEEYPQIRATLEKLYDKYGFDMIHEKLKL